MPVLAGVLLVAGCATTDRSVGVALFERARYADARAYYEDQAQDDARNTALDRNEAGVAALLGGDVVGARAHFYEAYLDMEDLSSTTGETIGALVGPARSRRFKGEPHERCLNAYYLGITNWLLGDVDNAAAAFRAGVLRDADSAEGASQSDFALLWYLLGQAQRAALHSDRGEQAFAQARELQPDNPWTKKENAETGNVVVVLETGWGPEKVPAGYGGAALRFRRTYGGPAAYASISSAGRSLGDTFLIGDVYHQAVTRGDGVVDDVNQGKAALKGAAHAAGVIVLHESDSSRDDALGAALLLGSLLTPSEADVRTWRSLPAGVQVLVADLPPGEHVLRVDVRDSAGNPLPDLAQEIPVVVRSGHVTLAWTRTVPATAWSAAAARYADAAAPDTGNRGTR